MHIPNITDLINDIQRSKLKESVFIQTAVQHYQTHLFEIQAFKGEKPVFKEPGDDMFNLMMNRAMSFNRDELVQLATMRNVETNEEMTKENIVSLLGGK